VLFDTFKIEIENNFYRFCNFVSCFIYYSRSSIEDIQTTIKNKIWMKINENLHKLWHQIKQELDKNATMHTHIDIKKLGLEKNKWNLFKFLLM
jgi:hypothetical protein